jgi:mono/diheme cytochrome c family protein
MKRNLFLAGITAVCAAFLLIPGFSQDSAKTSAAPASNQVKRGEYLVTVGVCHDCHTPKNYKGNLPEPDLTRALSGHPADAPVPSIPTGMGTPGNWMLAGNEHFTAWAGPWGVSFASNLTPDEETGIGTWTEDMFIKAIRTGKHMGEGRDILPPMPWPYFAKATDDDLKAIFAYLRSLKPVKNAVPDPVPPAGQ